MFSIGLVMKGLVICVAGKRTISAVKWIHYFSLFDRCVEIFQKHFGHSGSSPSCPLLGQVKILEIFKSFLRRSSLHETTIFEIISLTHFSWNCQKRVLPTEREVRTLQAQSVFKKVNFLINWESLTEKSFPRTTKNNAIFF